MVELLVISVSIFAFALVSERLSMSPITGPMFFTATGLIVGYGGLNWFDLELGSETVSILVEATLVLVLFTDAIRINVGELRTYSWFPARLLAIGLPLTVGLGLLGASLVFPALSLAEAALLAAVLAPTDAALGQAVVSDRRLPVLIRQGLNVESGLNDGIMVPVVTVALAVAAVEASGGGSASWVELILKQVGFGLICGAVIGAIGGRLLNMRAIAGQVEGIFRQLATLAIAVAAFATADLLEGNGFIAAFVAGIAFGSVAREQCSDAQDFTEDEAILLTSVTFIIFGAILAGPVLGDLTWQIALYVALSLTVFRMIPVLIALVGTGMLFETRVFAGWFGPRGLASILFALLIVEDLAGPRAHEIFVTATWTVLASVFLHGLTASPWVSRLAKRLKHAPDSQSEMEETRELPPRRGVM